MTTRRALLLVLLLAATAMALPWNRWFWFQWDTHVESEYGDCGTDRYDYAGHLSFSQNFRFAPGMTVYISYCRPRKAWEPRYESFTVAGFGWRGRP